jgi:hypothetical protein
VIWRYVIATSLLAEIGSWAYPRSPHSFRGVLHLLVEFALSSERALLQGPSTGCHQ